MIIYGGFGSSCGCDVWVLSNANGSGGTPTWTETTLNTPPFPTGRSGHSAVLDPTTDRMTIYGGFDESGNVLSDVWVLSNANGLGGPSAWKQLGPLPVFPVGRTAHTAVYVPSTNQMVVFGGESALGDGTTVSITFNDTWVLSHANGM
jgi:Kelch motif